MKKTKKQSNKGFTLVELIIVVAIIAVLAAVLAPQYLQYVERARQSNDLQVATNYMKAATVALADLSVGSKTADNEWFVFKWGYNTNNSGGMNVHMGSAGVNAAGMPTGTGGIDGSGNTANRDPELQIAVAQIMGWADEQGNIDVDEIPRPQSSAAAVNPGTSENSFIFYVSTRTGQILIDKGSAVWVNEIGVNAPLIDY